jgi:hypothetical protein
MALNRKGQVVFFGLMLGVLIVVLALGITPVLKSFVDNARSPTTDTSVGLDCNNESISDYQKSQCTITDLSLPYFFLGLIGIALLVIGAKAVIG